MTIQVWSLLQLVLSLKTRLALGPVAIPWTDRHDVRRPFQGRFLEVDQIVQGLLPSKLVFSARVELG